MKRILSVLLIFFSAFVLATGVLTLELFTGYEVIEGASYGAEEFETYAETFRLLQDPL